MSSEVLNKAAKGSKPVTSQKIYIGNRDQVPITCARCGLTKYMDVTKVSNWYRPFRVNCSCRFSFLVIFEKRGYYRKVTDLTGYCARLDSEGVDWMITVENLSQTGIGFRTSAKNDIAVNERLKIEFTLDNEQKTVVKTTLIVACVKDKYVGGKFQDLPGHAKKQIGFYLMR